MRTKSQLWHAVMKNANIWTDMVYQCVAGNTKIRATIPERLLKKKDKTIPAAILNMIRFPSAENLMKLRIKGVKVEYSQANVEFSSIAY